ncbi:hypothetical protein P7C70_g5691, partial [Phenoliferia sp. Uapishka_3]
PTAPPLRSPTRLQHQNTDAKQPSPLRSGQYAAIATRRLSDHIESGQRRPSAPFLPPKSTPAQTSPWKPPFPRRVPGTPANNFGHEPIFDTSRRRRSLPSNHGPSSPFLPPSNANGTSPFTRHSSGSHLSQGSSPRNLHPLQRRPPPPPSTHASTDLESSDAGSVKSVKSWDRSVNSVVSSISDDDHRHHESDFDSDPPRPPRFKHGALSTKANHEDSVAGDVKVPRKIKVTEEDKARKRKERAEREKRIKEKEDAKRDVVHRTFVSTSKNWEIGGSGVAKVVMRGAGAKRTNLLGLGANGTSNGKAAHVALSGGVGHGVGKASGTTHRPPAVNERTASSWQQLREAEIKQAVIDDAATFKQRMAEKIDKREAKERAKRNKRMEERRYNAFMNEPLGRHFTYPDQYQELDRLDDSEDEYERYLQRIEDDKYAEEQGGSFYEEMGNGSLASDSFPRTDTTESNSSAGRWTPVRTPVQPRADEEAQEDEGPISAVVVENLASPELWMEGAKTGERADLRSEAAGTLKRRESETKAAASDRSSLRDFSNPSSWNRARAVGKFVKCSAWPVVLFVINHPHFNFFSASVPRKRDGADVSERTLVYPKIDLCDGGRIRVLHFSPTMQFRAKQRAQINERKTQDAKRRFSNYIFHEVRVPLNTSLLAFQNLKAANFPDKRSEHHIEYAALESSLSLMKTVLNVRQSSCMPNAIKADQSRAERTYSTLLAWNGSIIGPLRLDATARGLELVASLDPRIDEVAVRAMNPPGAIISCEEGDGILMGDEIRIRQVINNLASNACKFTNKGGKISITTKLIFPTSPALLRPLNHDKHQSDSTLLMEKETESEKVATADSTKTPPCVVVRVEVTDTGVGIKSCDLKDGAMFSAYHQNHQTLLQGGKGTGLGLSLVKQIVSLSNGRLGVESHAGRGSTFFVELPLGTITPEMASNDTEYARHHSQLASELATPQSAYSDASEFDFDSHSVIQPADAEIETLVKEEEVTATEEDIQTIAPATGRTSSNPAVTLCTPDDPPKAEPSIVSSPVPSDPNPEDLKPKKSANKPAMEFVGGPLRALVVDDDSLTRKLMSRMISRLGCDVQTAENGAIALDMILAESGSKEVRINYDIIFLDNQMPVCTGLQVVAKLKELGRDDLVCGVTANAEHRDQQEYLDAGASVVLTKPIREVDLRRLLCTADEKRATLVHPAPVSSTLPLAQKQSPPATPSLA